MLKLVFVTLAAFTFIFGYCYDESDLIDPTKPEEDTYLNDEDFRNFDELDSNRLVKAPMKCGLDPEEYGTVEAEHDEDDTSLGANRNDRVARNALRYSYKHWENGIIPYVLSSTYSSFGRKIIAKSMHIFHSETCIRFVPRDNHRDYISILPLTLCSSEVGRRGGRQNVSLPTGCLEIGTVTHELMHAIGFFHEHQRSDRHEYVNIHWENILPHKIPTYGYLKETHMIGHLNTEYHYGSVMHYGEYDFSINDTLKTISARKPTNGQVIGQRDGPSDIDILRINRLYSCSMNETTTNATVSGCVDKYRQCAWYKNEGWCWMDKKVMQHHCAKECGYCVADPDSPVAPPTAPMILPAFRSCKDYFDLCEAYKYRGYCTNNQDRYFMKINCIKSCSNCETEEDKITIPPNTCGNRSPTCYERKDRGLCQSPAKKKEMQRVCEKACGYCGAGSNSSATLPTTTMN